MHDDGYETNQLSFSLPLTSTIATEASIGVDFCFWVLGRTRRQKGLGGALAPYDYGPGSVVSSQRGPGKAQTADEFSKFWSFQNSSAETWNQLLTIFKIWRKS